MGNLFTASFFKKKFSFGPLHLLIYTHIPAVCMCLHARVLACACVFVCRWVGVLSHLSGTYSRPRIRGNLELLSREYIWGNIESDKSLPIGLTEFLIIIQNVYIFFQLIGWSVFIKYTFGQKLWLFFSTSFLWKESPSPSWF